MTSSRINLRVSALSVLLAACAGRTPSSEPVPQPAPAPVPTAEVPAPSAKMSWVITPATQASRYMSTVSATIESTSGSEAARDTVTQQMRFSLLTATSSGSTAYLGSITDISSFAGIRIGSDNRPPVFPISFTGHISNGTMTIDELNGRVPGDQLDCRDPVYAALNSIQRRVVVVPSQITTGTSWTDSLTTKACNGLVPVTTASVRNSRVIGPAQVNGIAAILIDRTERTLSSGEGSDGQHRILLKGETTGSTRLSVDARTGGLLASEGEQRTDLVITTGQSRRFTQIVREKTTIQH